MKALERVLHYHQQTKHHFNRLARSLGYLDWANQPDPFRRYEGAPLIRLPLFRPDEAPVSPLYEDLFRTSAVPAEPVTRATLSRFLEYALSLTAWKQAGEVRWSLRSNPSSGNLHPTEGYVILDRVPDLESGPGLYHYAPREHGLEHRLRSSDDRTATLLAAFPPHAFLTALTSIHWREAWKYGERAFRYCQHDVGHAVGSLRIAAATLGWRLVVLDGVPDDLLSALLGLTRDEDFEGAEREAPDLIAVVWPDHDPVCFTMPPPASLPLSLEQEAVKAFIEQPWVGKANRLSRDEPVRWEIIEDVAEASWHAASDRTSLTWLPSPPGKQQDLAAAAHASAEPKAWQIIHQRRSALAFDGTTSIPVSRFFTMLRRVLPQPHLPVAQRPMPWDAIAWNPTIHLGLFVHRVEGLAPGLYMLIRDGEPRTKDALQKATHGQFAWTAPPGCPPDLPLFLLEEGNAQRLAAQISCWQDIAGMSAFALGMVAAFDSALHEHGPWFYRALFWETGVIGQVLYLEAEAAGVRATGIGCFFDDAVHQLFGLGDTAYQSLYHFTTGGHVDDPRLTTLPPYGERSSGEGL